MARSPPPATTFDDTTSYWIFEMRTPYPSKTTCGGEHGGLLQQANRAEPYCRARAARIRGGEGAAGGGASAGRRYRSGAMTECRGCDLRIAPHGARASVRQIVGTRHIRTPMQRGPLGPASR